jgi:hypothetical protein
MTREEKELRLVDLDCDIGERLAQFPKLTCDLPEVESIRIVKMTDDELDSAIRQREQWLLCNWDFHAA